MFGVWLAKNTYHFISEETRSREKSRAKATDSPLASIDDFLDFLATVSYHDPPSSAG